MLTDEKIKSPLSKIFHHLLNKLDKVNIDDCTVGANHNY